MPLSRLDPRIPKFSESRNLHTQRHPVVSGESVKRNTWARWGSLGLWGCTVVPFPLLLHENTRLVRLYPLLENSAVRRGRSVKTACTNSLEPRSQLLRDFSGLSYHTKTLEADRAVERGKKGKVRQKETAGETETVTNFISFLSLPFNAPPPRGLTTEYCGGGRRGGGVDFPRFPVR